MTLVCGWEQASTLQFAEHLYLSTQKQTEITVLYHFGGKPTIIYV